MSASDEFAIVRPLFAGVFAEALRQGQPTLCMAHVFTPDEPVPGEALATAWEKTVRVYPYFSEAVVRRDGAYYLAEKPFGFVIRETDEYVEPSTEAANFHTVSMCYRGNKLRIYMDHAPTDGTASRMVLATFSITTFARSTA